MYKAVIHSNRILPQDIALLQSIGSLQTGNGYSVLESAEPFDCDVLREQYDCNQLLQSQKPIKLVISDMDSTLIAIECIDEIADFVGVKEQVSAITQRAMAGELDFEASLQQRVALLEGLSIEALQQVYEQRLRFNAGAERLLVELNCRNIPFALVSGGFTFFTDRVQKRLGFEYARSNVLEVVGGKLTGRTIGPIIDAAAKKRYLLELCAHLGIEPAQTIAIGDGANDLPMLQTAAISVAFRAKPIVRHQASWQLNHSGLDSILSILEQQSV